MRVAIADDSVTFRSDLAGMLEASGVEITASVSTGQELLAEVRDDLPDAAVIDLRMPPTFSDEGIKTAAELRRSSQDLGILIVSAQISTIHATRLFDTVSNGVGYLLKESVADSCGFLDSLTRVVDKGCVVDDAIVDRLLAGRRTRGSMSDLNAQERLLLRMLANGRTDASISDHLAIGLDEVQARIHGVFTKLGLDQQDAGRNRLRKILGYLRGA
jgi:DNA-binding NarL/FixJ family response regulator